MTENKKPLTRQGVISTLEVDWKAFPAKFKSMDDSQKKVYLSSQGFTSLTDLLAHVIAWWEEAYKVVRSIIDLEELPQKEYDIDAFNAAAIKHYQKWSEADLLKHYENVRFALLELMAEIPADGLENKRIRGWLNACIVEHFESHAIG